MCCKAVRMGMISSRQAVLSWTSRTGVQSRRSWGSKAIRMGEDLEEFLARELAIDSHEGILTRGPHSSRGTPVENPEKDRLKHVLRRRLASQSADPNFDFSHLGYGGSMDRRE